MDAARYQRLKELLFEANRIPGPDRAAFLDAACEDDVQLRREVESLLRGADVDTVDLQEPVGTAALRATDLPPPPWHCGGYRIEREVGRGGMGVVFEGRDLAADERVAVKLIPPLFAGAPLMGERFAREAELGRQIDHPNVVRTIDYGNVTVRGMAIPFLVMEFVEGQTLRELLAELGTVPESLLREIAEQVSLGLAAIHACGIVHRDLKPENVLITRDRRVRIMDLGIAKLRDATIELTREGQFVGSLHYAAPEQCRDDGVGAATDLYSLGVVLYELATGRNPFRRENAAAVIHAHLELAAPPLSDTSPFFSELVSTLLAKDPAGRFPSARELAQVLAAGERGTWWANRRSATAVHTAVRLDVPRRTRMVGRERELMTLLEAWERATRGDGGTVLVAGEAGIGKSRVVDEFLRVAGAATVHVLSGSFLPGSGLRGIADSILARFPAARVESTLEPYLPDAPVLRQTFAALLRGEAIPEGRGDILVSGSGKLLEGLAAERPVLWILEDLHDAPAAAWRVVQSLARTVTRCPALLVLTARPPVADATIESIRRTERLTRLDLTRLQARDIDALVRDAVGDRTDVDRLAARVAKKSDGNPLFALAMLGTDGPAEDTAVPSEIHELIAARLATLDRDQRTLLDAAAVQGVEFDAELLAGVLGQPVVGLLQELAELERSRGIVRAAGRLYRFDHNLLQEVLYAQLPERLRAEYHTRLADAYERRVEGEPWGVQAEFLARHHLSGVEPGRALPHVAAALDHLHSRYLYEAALDLIERTFDVGALDERERIGLLEKKEGMLYLLGRRVERRETITEMIERSDRIGDPAVRAIARRALGSWHQATGHEPESLAAFERAVEFAREAGDRALECSCLSQSGRALARLRRTDEALETQRVALALAREIGNRDLESYIEANIAQALRHVGRYAEARRTYERAADIAEELGLEKREAAARGALGVVFVDMGLWDEANHHLQRARDFGRRVGSVQLEAPAVGNLGILEVQRGRLAAARELCRIHLALSAEIGAARSEAVAIGALGTIEMHLGHANRARSLLVDARKRAEATHAPQLVAADEHALGRTWILDEDPDSARPRLQAAIEGYRRIENADFLARALIDLAACELAAGRRGDAETRLREALAVGESLDLPALRFGALALLGRHDEARAVDRDAGDRIPVLDRMLARWRLGDREGASELLDLLVENAPVDAREGMRTRVALYRSIAG